MPIDDATLLAYLDGQLDDDQYTPVEDALAQHPALRERLQALVDSGEQVQRAFDAKLQEPVPARLVQAILQAPLNLTPPTRAASITAAPGIGQRAAQALSAWWQAPAAGGWGRAALASVAVLAMGVWLGQSLQNDGATAAATLAQGQAVPDIALASALELAPSGRRLNTAQGHVEVIATFARADGALCREFERQQGAQVDVGIACRGAEGGAAAPWQVAMVVSDTRTTAGYQTASDAQHQAVNRYIDQQLQAAPLDAATERALIDKAWSR